MTARPTWKHIRRLPESNLDTIDNNNALIPDCRSVTPQPRRRPLHLLESIELALQAPVRAPDAGIPGTCEVPFRCSSPDVIGSLSLRGSGKAVDMIFTSAEAQCAIHAVCSHEGGTSLKESVLLLTPQGCGNLPHVPGKKAAAGASPVLPLMLRGKAFP
ncbi:hypothetical protein NDU88_010650 [Pleurodeles waltl]|uniref:Uncharacterized protein n=1 Tax=Pleurodeles waltl TaxID=8319 RepID=A0AAV7QUY9_PLEWA|nr:hypothetical protein NDU88_010650 [Pleurodeles waltl]